MLITAKALWLPKAGSAPDEYEDAYWPETRHDGVSSPARFAVADGATETSFSGIWAKLLVEAYCKGWFEGSSPQENLENLRHEWRVIVNKKPLPWYAEEKRNMGAFSSLVGLTLSEGERLDGAPGKWTASAIGDSCLFHIRSEAILAAFPLNQSTQFDNRPLLISTNSINNQCISDSFVKKEGEWEPGDIFYLMTDALACWLFRRQEDDGGGIVGLSDVRTQDDFSVFIQSEREEMQASGRPWLHNDDVTLLRIEVS